MIRRLLYHFFWNFYDYLGSYLLLGFACSTACFVIALGGVYLVQVPASGILYIALLAVVGVAASIAVAASMAGLFAFATRASRDEPARLIHFREGLKAYWVPYLKLILVGCAGILIVSANIAFYTHLAGKAVTPAGRSGFVVAAMLFFWIGAGLFLFLHPLLATPARFSAVFRLVPTLRKAFVLLAIAPQLWIATAVLFSAIAVLCVISVAGLLFVMPVFASLTSTALDISVRHAEFLATAREVLGPGRRLAEYRRKAVELGWDRECSLPRRTLRELIKPWE
jgi:hypothetical protein